MSLEFSEHIVGGVKTVYIRDSHKQPSALPQNDFGWSVAIHVEVPPIPSHDQVHPFVSGNGQRDNSEARVSRIVKPFHCARDQVFIQSSAQQGKPHSLTGCVCRLDTAKSRSVGDTGSPDDSNLKLLKLFIIDPPHLETLPNNFSPPRSVAQQSFSCGRMLLDMFPPKQTKASVILPNLKPFFALLA